MQDFLKRYFSGHQEVINNFLEQPQTQDNLIKVITFLKTLAGTGRTVFMVGNGGSSAIVEHIAIDLTKCNNIRTFTFSGTPLLTCLANDYGFEHLFEKAVELYAKKDDVLIAVSSSGSSKNILNACKAAKEKDMPIITFSGFNATNPLSTMGNYNFWVDSKSFGYLELIHNLILHYINDAIFGEIEYLIKG